MAHIWCVFSPNAVRNTTIKRSPPAEILSALIFCAFAPNPIIKHKNNTNDLTI